MYAGGVIFGLKNESEHERKNFGAERFFSFLLLENGDSLGEICWSAVRLIKNL